MFGFGGMIGAARLMHSENVNELMEALADDARTMRRGQDCNRMETRLEMVSSTHAATAVDAGQAPRSIANEDRRLACKSAA